MVYNMKILSVCICGSGDVSKALVYLLSIHKLFNVYWYSSKNLENNFEIISNLIKEKKYKLITKNFNYKINKIYQINYE